MSLYDGCYEVAECPVCGEPEEMLPHHDRHMCLSCRAAARAQEDAQEDSMPTPQIPSATLVLEDDRVVTLSPYGWHQPPAQRADHGPLTGAEQLDAWSAQAHWMATDAATAPYRARTSARSARRAAR